MSRRTPAQGREGVRTMSCYVNQWWRVDYRNQVGGSSNGGYHASEYFAGSDESKVRDEFRAKHPDHGTRIDSVVSLGVFEE